MTYIYALHCIYDVGFPGGSGCKESACNAGDPGLVPGLGKSPGERNGSLHSSVLAWRIPWTEEPGGLWSMGLQRVDMTERRTFLFTSSTTYTYIYIHTHIYVYTLLSYVGHCKQCCSEPWDAYSFQITVFISLDTYPEDVHIYK